MEPTNSTQESPKWERLPDGQHAMGLQAIKNCTIKGFKGYSSRLGKEVDEPDRPGFRFVFRSYETPMAFAFLEVKAYYGEKSKLYEVLRGMCSSLGPIKSHEEAASLLKALIGGWYLVNIATKTTKAGKPWSYVQSVAMCPRQLCQDWGTSHDYFAGLGGPSGTPVNDDLLAQFLASMPRNGKGRPNPSPSKKEEPTAQKTGLEDMPDISLEKSHPFLYDLVGCQRFGPATALLEKENGIAVNGERTLWRTPKKVLQLEKYLVVNIMTDDLPDGF